MSETHHADGDFRIEHDSMGEVRVPSAAKWAAQTQRAVENFPVSHRTIDARIVHALGMIKAEAARVNAADPQVPKVDAAIGEVVAAAADEVAAGTWDAEFPVDVYQTGSGTSSNMNTNEVIATLASERLGGPGSVHPNDHVNASQSSNDVFPSAVHLAVALAVTGELRPALARLAEVLRERAEAFGEVVKPGRTHLMDATPVTLGQEFTGYAGQIEADLDRLEPVVADVCRLPIGGTAVGTGINAPAGFGAAVAARLAERTGLPLVETPNHFAVHGARDDLVAVSGVLRTVAVSLTKIANDLRWAASGPRAGLAEIHLPDLQPGSSIMPGKVNPVLAEAVTQVAARVFGNDASVAFGGSQGNFEMNVYVPMMADAIIESIVLLSNVSRLFADNCVAGIEADVERCRALAEASPSIATSLNPFIGYEKAAALVHDSIETGKSVRELVNEANLLSDDEIDRAFDLLGQARGGLA
ncbi:MAG: class II fumarate hydratase [Actinobacteria bacterium]|nr:class II fumarate hydratase [Actinomycetota bacterium]